MNPKFLDKNLMLILCQSKPRPRGFCLSTHTPQLGNNTRKEVKSLKKENLPIEWWFALVSFGVFKEEYAKKNTREYDQVSNFKPSMLSMISSSSIPLACMISKFVMLLLLLLMNDNKRM